MIEIPENKHPATLWEICEDDPEAKFTTQKGGHPAKYLLVDFDPKDQWGFPTKEDADAFIQIHGFVVIPEAQMKFLRGEEKTKK
jgi:hypothetical protein